LFTVQRAARRGGERMEIAADSLQPTADSQRAGVVWTAATRGYFRIGERKSA
jgi:hypothetical protein